jgi:hypothetical protein
VPRSRLARRRNHPAAHASSRGHRPDSETPKQTSREFHCSGGRLDPVAASQSLLSTNKSVSDRRSPHLHQMSKQTITPSRATSTPTSRAVRKSWHVSVSRTDPTGAEARPYLLGAGAATSCCTPGKGTGRSRSRCMPCGSCAHSTRSPIASLSDSEQAAEADNARASGKAASPSGHAAALYRGSAAPCRRSRRQGPHRSRSA